MKNRILFLGLLLLSISIINPVSAEEQERTVPSFSSIGLHISADVYLKQGDKQSVTIEAKESVLEDIITEVKDGKLHIRFPKNYMFHKFNPGKIEIHITVPEVDGLSISGSGNIVTDKLNSQKLDLAISGSGNIKIGDLSADQVKGAISGSGGIDIDDGGVANEMKVSISGSGNVKASRFEAENVTAHISGSGNCSVKSNGTVKAYIAGSGSVYYSGNPSIDSSVAGSGRVKKM